MDGRKRYCSRHCKDRAIKDAAIAARLLAKPERSCPHCGDPLARAMRTDAVFCSNACMESAHNATRKAKWKVGYPVEYVSRAEIIERDGGICHICGKTCTEGELTLDHIVPLARGGTHEKSNLAVACLSCNCSKRHTLPT